VQKLRPHKTCYVVVCCGTVQSHDSVVESSDRRGMTQSFGGVV